MLNLLLAAALGFLAGIAFLALAQYLFRRLGERRGPTVESIRPVEIVDEELIAVLAAAASETLQAPLRVLSHRVEPKR